MKGIDLIPSFTQPEPTAEAAVGASEKDAKQFDALLARAVEGDARGAGQDRAAQMSKGAPLLAQEPLLATVAPSANEAGDVDAGLPVTRGDPRSAMVRSEPANDRKPGAALRALELSQRPRSIHDSIQRRQEQLISAAEVGPLAELGESKPKLEMSPTQQLEDAAEVTPADEDEPSPERMQMALAQVASVVARIVAPPPVAQPGDDAIAAVATATKDAVQSFAAEQPAIDAGEFQDALDATLELVPHGQAGDESAAVTVRPGAEATTLVPGTSPSVAPRVERSSVRMVADKVLSAFRALSPLSKPAPGEPIADLGQLAADSRPTVPAPGSVVATAAPAAAHASAQGAKPVRAASAAMTASATAGAVAPELPSARAAETGAVRSLAQPGAASMPQPAQGADRAPTALTAAGAAQPPPAQPPVVVQVQSTPATPELAAQQAEAAAVQGEQGAQDTLDERGEGETRDRVHGFERGGFGKAMSAYGGRGHEGGERGGERSGERASERLASERDQEERLGELATGERVAQQQEPLSLQAQPTQQAEPARPAQPASAPAAPAAAPVPELPDVVFQGRANPAAANENASISLHHPDLGPIRLEVHREQGRIEVHALIENQHAQAVLRANESGIRQGVQQTGLSFSALRVRMRDEEPSTSRGAQARRQRRSERET